MITHTHAPTKQIMDGLSAALLALALGDYVSRNKKQDPRDETGQAGIDGIVDVEVERGPELIRGFVPRVPNPEPNNYVFGPGGARVCLDRKRSAVCVRAAVCVSGQPCVCVVCVFVCVRVISPAHTCTNAYICTNMEQSRAVQERQHALLGERWSQHHHFLVCVPMLA